MRETAAVSGRRRVRSDVLLPFITSTKGLDRSRAVEFAAVTQRRRPPRARPSVGPLLGLPPRLLPIALTRRGQRRRISYFENSKAAGVQPGTIDLTRKGVYDGL
jgi:hypothetical protein